MSDASVTRRGGLITDEWKYPAALPFDAGLLQVDVAPDHKLHWEQYGNPAGEPVMVLHGGPGGACAPVMARFFDPDRYRIVLYDQRGCGRSEPTVAEAGRVALVRNTTGDLVGDIERLRDALGIGGGMHVFGGSWGSTLALAYSIRHPENVASLILRGIFLGSPEELRYVFQGNARTFAQNPYALTEPGSYIHHPDEWEAFVRVIAHEDRHDMVAAYEALFEGCGSSGSDPAAVLRAALAWSAWEGSISHLDPASVGSMKFEDPTFALSLAQIEAHYFANRLFLDPNHILANVDRIAGIPTHIVHGRFDLVCPLTQASLLVAALTSAGAAPSTYVRTYAGHSAMELETALALTAVMDGLPPIL